MLLIVCTETIKNSEHHLIKINRLRYITISSKSQIAMELMASFQNQATKNGKFLILVKLISKQIPL